MSAESTPDSPLFVVVGCDAIFNDIPPSCAYSTKFLSCAKYLKDDSLEAEDLRCLILKDEFEGDEERRSVIASTKAFWPRCFICVYDQSNSCNAKRRWEATSNGANMVTSSCKAVQQVIEQLRMLLDTSSGERAVECPLCTTEVSNHLLLDHCGLFHCAERPKTALCPLCGAKPHNFQRHMKYNHGTPHSSPRPVSVGVGIVCQRASDGRYLLVQEFCNQGWYLPAGIVEPGEDPLRAVVREASEEAGVGVKVTSIVRVMFKPHPANRELDRFIVTYYGHPIDESQPAKTLPDYESVGAVWASRDELSSLRRREAQDADVLDLLDAAESGVRLPLTAFKNQA